MVSKQELNKRRVTANKASVRHQQAGTRATRRRQRGLRVGISLLALALIAPLTIGLIAALQSGNSPAATNTTQPPTTIAPNLVEPEHEGVALTGPTPCPATDGTQERTTSFETAPPSCIDPTAVYTATFVTTAGPIEINLDAAAAPEAANLFVTLARYGVYDRALVTAFPGVLVLGSWGSAGFSVPATEAPADGSYPVGSVAMLTESDETMQGRIVIITSQAGADAIALDPTSPIIGTVTTGLATATAVGGGNLESATVTGPAVS